MTAHEPNHQIAVPPIGRSPLYRADWEYIDKTDLFQFTRADYAKLGSQREIYNRERQADAVLSLLAAGEHEPTFGYQINNYQHCLQAATMLHADGYDEETVVVGLLHDVGFLACPERHGAFAAELLGGYVSDENYWMLRHHQAFATFVPVDAEDPEQELPWHRWRSHPYARWTTNFVNHYDQNAVDPSYGNRPLELFEPMVRRIFSRSPKPLRLDS
jgi:predicted HD phosphohydrolase